MRGLSVIKGHIIIKTSLKTRVILPHIAVSNFLIYDGYINIKQRFNPQKVKNKCFFVII